MVMVTWERPYEFSVRLRFPSGTNLDDASRRVGAKKTYMMGDARPLYLAQASIHGHSWWSGLEGSL